MTKRQLLKTQAARKSKTRQLAAATKKRQAKRSKPQLRAQHKRAVAGGRASAAKIAQFGQSKAQKQSTRHWAAAGRASQAKARKAAGELLGDLWIGAPNEILPCCGEVAIANSLLLAAGWRVSDDAVMELARWHPAGATLAEIFETLDWRGLGGVRPFSISPATALTPGVVAGLTVPGWEPHAVTVSESSVISWGMELDDWLLGYADEAWEVTWPH